LKGRLSKKKKKKKQFIIKKTLPDPSARANAQMDPEVRNPLL
jgi:hypothetical protein